VGLIAQFVVRIFLFSIAAGMIVAAVVELAGDAPASLASEKSTKSSSASSEVSETTSSRSSVQDSAVSSQSGESGRRAVADNPASATQSAAPPAQRSPEAMAAFRFLEKNLVATPQLLFSGSFRAVDGDICHGRATESIGFYPTIDIDFKWSDVDLNTIVIKGDKVRAVNASASTGRTFYVAVQDSQKKTWSDWKQADSLALIIADTNEDSVLRAISVLAKDCGASPGF